MALNLVPYTADLEHAVQRFNRRMAEAHAPADFGISEIAPACLPGAVVQSLSFVATDSENEVRGGVILLQHPGWISGRVETVLNLQSPLSEGIVDPKYGMLAIQLIRFALKLSPYVYIVGMGNENNPLPRSIKAAGWTVRPVPFFFRFLNVSRCLKELRPLQRTPLMRLGASLAAGSGAGWLGLKFLQRRRPRFEGDRYQKVSTIGPADDLLWSSMQQRCSFGVVRDSTTLPLYYGKNVERFQVVRDGTARAWFSLVVATMKDDKYFGNLKVAILLDVVPGSPADAPRAVALASDYASSTGCDLIVSNQLHREIRDAALAAGFLTYSSNFLLGTSKALTDNMQDESAFVTRQDGDGLVNLAGS